MSSDIRYVVDEQEFTTPMPHLTVADVLDRVGLTTDRADLVTADGVAHADPDESLEVSDGERFQTRRRGDQPATGRVIHYEVNGEPQATTRSQLTVGAILERAGRAAGVDPDDIGDYYLQNLKTGHRYDDLADMVMVHDGDRFLAVHRGATPVA